MLYDFAGGIFQAISAIHMEVQKNIAGLFLIVGRLCFTWTMNLKMVSSYMPAARMLFHSDGNRSTIDNAWRYQTQTNDHLELKVRQYTNSQKIQTHS